MEGCVKVNRMLTLLLLVFSYMPNSYCEKIISYFLGWRISKQQAVYIYYNTERIHESTLVSIVIVPFIYQWNLPLCEIG